MSFGTVSAKDINGNEHEIQLDEDTVKSILAVIRSQGKADSRFDFNLAEGKIAESELSALIENGAVEVKRDFKVSETGNLAIEFMCGGKPSGISVTKADWWGFMLDGNSYNGEVVVLIKTKRLERLLGKKIVKGGDAKKAEMYLVPVSQLLNQLKGVS